MKVDLCMWAKNGERSLPKVFTRIQQVVPCENICHKILVDDHSTDGTVDLAREFGWDVYKNPSGGISSGANEALKHVDSELSVSVEQDLILASDWWRKIVPYMNEKHVAVAQGIRLTTEKTFRKLEEDRYSSMLKCRDSTQLGVSLDNTILKTSIIRDLGGFPQDCPVCTDTILMKKLLSQTKHVWIVNPTVVSDHIRLNMKAYISHDYNTSKLCARTPYCFGMPQPSFTKMLTHFLWSPFRASILAWKKRCLKMLYAYPAIRFANLMGMK